MLLVLFLLKLNLFTLFVAQLLNDGLVTQLEKTEDGIRARTDHGEDLLADVVLFATGNSLPHVYLMKICL